MPAIKIRADYDRLRGVAQTFAAQAEASRRMLAAVKGAKHALEGGDWMGKGATAFYREMNDSVLPTLERLARALEQAGTVTSQISGVMHQAEGDAAHCFQLQGAAGAAGLAAAAGAVLGAAGAAAGLGAAGAAVGGAAGAAGAAVGAAGAVAGALGNLGLLSPGGLAQRAAALGASSLAGASQGSVDAVMKSLAQAAINGSQTTDKIMQAMGDSLIQDQGMAMIGPAMAGLGVMLKQTSAAEARAVQTLAEAALKGQSGLLDSAASQILNNPGLSFPDKVLEFGMQAAQRQPEAFTDGLSAFANGAAQAGDIQSAQDALGGGVATLTRLTQVAASPQSQPDLLQRLNDIAQKIWGDPHVSQSRDPHVSSADEQRQQMQEYQKKLQQASQLQQMMSNILHMMHETNKDIIRNIRG